MKKTVTAAERQREREEKRRKRQIRADQKAKQKEEEERKKNPLSEADKSSLDRWIKMQVNLLTSMSNQFLFCYCSLFANPGDVCWMLMWDVFSRSGFREQTRNLNFVLPHNFCI